RRHTRFSRDWSSDVCSSDLTKSPDFTQIVNQRHVDRIQSLLADHGGTVVTGGSVDEATRKLEPTIVVDPDPDSRLMQEEIFGPRSEERRVGEEWRAGRARGS